MIPSIGALLFMACTACKPYLLPDPVWQSLESQPGVTAVYRLNPGYLHGDFDGDGSTDFVIETITTAGSGAFFVIWGTGSSSLILPKTIAGAPPEMKFDFDGWVVLEHGWAGPEPADQQPPPKGDEIELIWAEKAGGFLYFSNGSWNYYSGGD